MIPRRRGFRFQNWKTGMLYDVNIISDEEGFTQVIAHRLGGPPQVDRFAVYGAFRDRLFSSATHDSAVVTGQWFAKDISGKPKSLSDLLP